MGKRNNIYTTVWLTLVLLTFSLPLIQELTGWIRLDDIRGKFKQVEKAHISIESWFSGDYQQQEEEYVKNKFSLRNFLIRLNAQFNYYCFNKSLDKNTVIGKDNYIFNDDVLIAYLGGDLKEEKVIQAELEKLKFVQDTLEKLNKHFVFIIAPSKPPISLDKIPDAYRKKPTTTNYDLFIKQMNQLHINHIDYRTYFQELKKQTPYLLFPPKGLHWSIYSTSFVIDSLIHYIETNANTHLTTYKWSEVTLEEAKGNDVDVEVVLNLLYKIESPKLAYRKLLLEKKHNDSLKVITMGDSFYAELFNNGLNEVLPSNNEFWYYGKLIKAHDYNDRNDLHFYQLDLKKKVMEADFIMMLYNDANLKGLAFGMIDRLYRLFKNQSLVLPVDEEYAGYISERMEKFKMDPKKMQEIKEKSIYHKISVDSMLEVEAIMSVELSVWTRNIILKKK